MPIAKTGFLIVPPPLKPGGTIGVVSPGRWPKPEWISVGKGLLEKHGYKVVVHAQNYLKAGQLAGSDAARAEAIMDMFADPKIDAIMCARGGTGSIRLLDKLDYKLIKKNPKPFIGYSDITVLLHALQRKAGLITYHGPMTHTFSNPHDPRTVEEFFAQIGPKNKTLKQSFPQAECVRPGRAEGTLIGGNMTLLESLIGTPYDWSAKDGILFLEDVDEVLYKLDRILQHFRLAGKFDGVRAVLVGEMVDIVDGESSFLRKGEKPYGRDLKQILLDVLPPNVALGMNFPCGHGKYITTLPVGGEIKLSITDRGADISFA